jgi:hypothetical protein
VINSVSNQTKRDTNQYPEEEGKKKSSDKHNKITRADASVVSNVECKPPSDGSEGR